MRLKTSEICLNSRHFELSWKFDSLEGTVYNKTINEVLDLIEASCKPRKFYQFWRIGSISVWDMFGELLIKIKFKTSNNIQKVLLMNY